MINEVILPKQVAGIVVAGIERKTTMRWGGFVWTMIRPDDRKGRSLPVNTT